MKIYIEAIHTIYILNSGGGQNCFSQEIKRNKRATPATYRRVKDDNFFSKRKIEASIRQFSLSMVEMSRQEL